MVTRTVGSLWIAAVVALAALPAAALSDQPRGDALRAAVERARACVVQLKCQDRSGRDAPAILSAVAIDDGYLLTVGLRTAADHRLCARDAAGVSHAAEWVAADAETGLALLKVASGVIPTVEIDPEAPDVGAAALIVGNPYGLSHSVSVGNISGVGRSLANEAGGGCGLIQFTGPVFPGDSGGLLADQQGRMIGIVSTVLGDSRSGSAAGRQVSGIGFAIPAREAQRIVGRLRAGERIERGYLGVTVEEAEPAGVRVTTVAGESPAQLAGLRRGDVIEKVDDEPVKDVDFLAAYIDRLAPGSDLTLSVRRGADETRISVKLGERPASRPGWQPMIPWSAPWWGPGGRDFDAWRGWVGPLSRSDGALLGVETQPVTDALAKSLGLGSTDGALISRVVPDSPAARAGLRESDLVAAVNDEPVKDPPRLRELIRKAGAGAVVKLEIRRDQELLQVEATLSRGAAGPIGVDGFPWAIPSRAGSGNEMEERIELLETRYRELEARVRQLEQRLQAAPVPGDSPAKP